MNGVTQGLQGRRGVALLVVLVAAALSTVDYLAVLRPAHATWDVQAEIEGQASQQNTQVRDLEAQISDADKALADILGRLEEQRIDLGDASQLNQRIASLIDLARESGLDVSQLQPGGERETEHYLLLSMQLEAVALPEAHAKFLERLHEHFPDMSVMSLELTHGQQRGEARPRGVFRMAWFTAIQSAPVETPDAALSAAESS